MADSGWVTNKVKPDTGGEFDVRPMFPQDSSGIWRDRGFSERHSPVFASRGWRGVEFATSIPVVCDTWRKRAESGYVPVLGVTAQAGGDRAVRTESDRHLSGKPSALPG